MESQDPAHKILPKSDSYREKISIKERNINAYKINDQTSCKTQEILIAEDARSACHVPSPLALKEPWKIFLSPNGNSICSI